MSQMKSNKRALRCHRAPRKFINVCRTFVGRKREDDLEPRKRIRRDYSSLAACSALLLGFAFAPSSPSRGADTSNFHPQGDIQKLVISRVREFPFVSAQVNGTPGKLMFDIGALNALSLNDHLLSLGEGKVVGKGFTGSGQTYDVTLHPSVASVRIGDVEYKDVADVTSQNLDFLENGITPDALGFLGFDFFKGYLLKLNYSTNTLTLYRDTPERQTSKDFLQGETVLATLPFETRKLPNIPFIPVKIGEVDFLASFDTGQMGTVEMTPEAEAALTKASLISPQLIPAQAGPKPPPFWNLRHVKTRASFDFGLEGMRQTGPGPAREALGITEPNILTLGHAFLSQFTTVWDYANKRIYILKK